MDSGTAHPNHSIRYGSTTIPYSLAFSNRKTLGISVYPDLSVTVVAPFDAPHELIEKKVLKRAAWILKQKEFFKTYLPSPAELRYVSGETIRYLGKQYRLKVVVSQVESVKLRDGYLHVAAPERSQSEELVRNWLRLQAKRHFESSLARSLKRFSDDRLPETQVRIRVMKNRWGSVGRNKVIYLNPDLIRAPRICIDYVVTHELCHLLVADHSPKFYRCLAAAMSDWERWKKRLELSVRG